MRISDWSSDVCSSDLAAVQRVAEPVDDITDKAKPQPFVVDPAQHIASGDHDRAEEAERGELVGSGPGGQAGANPVEQAAFVAREEILLNEGRRAGRRGDRHESLSSPLSHRSRRGVMALS